MTWEVRFSKTRQLPYFYNPDTQVSMWELPENMTVEQARQLPGGSLLGEARPDQPYPAQSSSAGETVRASHILVKHKDSRRPSSHRQSVITRTKEEAIQTLESIKEKLGPKPTPSQFSEAARENRYVDLYLLTQRLFVCAPRWRPRRIRPWPDAAGVREGRIRPACWRDEWYYRDRQRCAPDPTHGLSFR